MILIPSTILVYSVSAASTLRYTVEKILASGHSGFLLLLGMALIFDIMPANAHRVFVSEEIGLRRNSFSGGTGSGGSSPVTASVCTSPSPERDPISPTVSTQLRGVVSVIDGEYLPTHTFINLFENMGRRLMIFHLVLALFARLAGLSDVDPARMQKHRRASSASSTSGTGSSPILPS